MANVVYLTQEGYEKLQEKYHDYVHNKRPDASEKIKAAREYGDLSENAEYDAAKEEQAMIEAEIKNMEEQLNNCVIIEESDGGDNKVVRIGSTVTVKDNNGEYSYKIVGSTEANILAGLISNESPMGKALLSRKLGDKVIVQAPKGNRTVSIIKID